MSMATNRNDLFHLPYMINPWTCGNTIYSVDIDYRVYNYREGEVFDSREIDESIASLPILIISRRTSLDCPRAQFSTTRSGAAAQC